MLKIIKSFIAFILFTIDFIRFPDCYLTTWRYQLKNDIFKLDIDKIEECLGVIEHNFLVIYNSKSNGDDEDGNNENMGS